jgi:hypothetical protein
MRLTRRALTRTDIFDAAPGFVLVESYPDERPYPGAAARLGDRTIVIIRSVPVLECRSCTEYLVADDDMQRIEKMLDRGATDAELAVIQFAA